MRPRHWCICCPGLETINAMPIVDKRLPNIEKSRKDLTGNTICYRRRKCRDCGLFIYTKEVLDES